MSGMGSFRLVCCALFLACSSAAHAGAVDVLQRFLARNKSFQAEFTQTVYQGQRAQHSSGTIAYQKPGRFRWETTLPHRQLIVGDGQKIWLFDPDLEQVTIRKMDQTLGATPAALLAGENELERFELSEGGTEDGLLWAVAIPRQQEANFARIRLGFSPDENLAALELLDHFGQITVMRFSQSRHNPALPKDFFTFTPPEGVDILEE
ncbi:MAG: outer membrane lipoprotein chaperone LolA [Zoogloeaceae bacterium]|jgi:outer membrane lipoprotein carrier protein|nr:outer membrane lipoprotein chaperone LolA [Zoogloeaceae bacterium]